MDSTFGEIEMPGTPADSGAVEISGDLPCATLFAGAPETTPPLHAKVRPNSPPSLIRSHAQAKNLPTWPISTLHRVQTARCNDQCPPNFCTYP